MFAGVFVALIGAVVVVSVVETEAYVVLTKGSFGRDCNSTGFGALTSLARFGSLSFLTQFCSDWELFSAVRRSKGTTFIIGLNGPGCDDCLGIRPIGELTCSFLGSTSGRLLAV